MTDEKEVTLSEQIERALNLLQNEDFSKVEFTTQDNLTVCASWVSDTKIRLEITAPKE